MLVAIKRQITLTLIDQLLLLLLLCCSCIMNEGGNITHTHHGVCVFNELILGDIVDLLGLLEQVTQEILKLIRLNVTRVISIVFTPDLIGKRTSCRN